jgi:CHAT domain-containing protein/tetratricopeptide (TPR) repeat protein
MPRLSPTALPLGALILGGLLLGVAPARGQSVSPADSLLAASHAQAEAGDLDAAVASARLALAALPEGDAPLADPLRQQRADAETHLGWLLFDQGRIDEAGDHLEAALALRAPALQPDDPALAESRLDLATVRHAQGRYRDALPLAEAAAEALEATGAETVAEALNLAAVLRFSLGDLGGARPLYERALALTEAALGLDHPDTGVLAINFAALLQQAGELDAARALYERGVAIAEASGDPLRHAVALDRLAFLLQEQGDLTEARRRYEHALALKESVPHLEGRYLVGTLHNLASVLAPLEGAAAAYPLYERAIRLSEEAFGPSHPEVGRNHRALGLLALAGGAWEDAREHLEAALDIQRQELGPGHPNVAETLTDLGALSARAGDPEHAEAYLAEALATWAASLGPGGYPEARALNERALLAQRLGRPAPEVLAPLMEATARVSAHAHDVLPLLSLAEQRAFLDAALPRQTSLLLSAADGAEPEVYAPLLGWKGLLQHALRRHSVLARLAEAESRATAAELQAVRTNLAAWYRAAGTTPPEVWQARADSLTGVKEQLERTLARALPEGGRPEGADDDPLATGGLPAFLTALPADAAFVDVYRYRHWEGGQPVEPRYAAVVTDREGTVRVVRLGSAERVDSLVVAWRAAVTRGGAASRETEALADAVWGPVARALPPAARRAWVSPDGQLAQVSWAALAEASGLLVAEVASPRALLRHLTRAPEPSPARTALLVGGVDFGPPDESVPAWAPLPGTAREVSAVAALAGRQGLAPTLLTDAAPTPEAVARALPRARYAHLATHGFFFRADEAAEGTRGFDVVPVGAASAGPSRNPLAESGLALAGANADPTANLTAEELIGLDLSGVALAVLSACDTGRGEEVTGQGVMGLRASFEAAGVGTLLMSLWKVPDESTALLMEAFYTALWDRGLPPAEALREAQATLRADPRHAAPLHWAAWVLSGRAW